MSGMSNVAGRKPAGLLRECWRQSLSSSTSSKPARRSIMSSAVQRSADPSPLEATRSMQESRTTEENMERRGNSGAGSPRRGGGGPLPDYPQWRKSAGKAFEETPRGQGPFWLGQTPFPLNLSFQPPPPVAYPIRQTMWKLHKADKSKNSIRALSGRFGLPMERVVAVLRLMALEEEFGKEGKPLQKPFQKEMDRLLGALAKPELLRREQATLTEGEGASGLRGPIFEAVENSAAKEEPDSAIRDALQVESAERKARIKLMPTGGPALKGDALALTQTGKASRPNRPPVAFVDVSNRPLSYAGVGKLRQNVKRAEQKRANLLRRRARDPAWERRHEISLLIAAGDRSPELLAEKRTLDQEKVQADAVLTAQRLKRYKSNRKFKAAMKIARSQAATQKVEQARSPTDVL